MGYQRSLVAGEVAAVALKERFENCGYVVGHSTDQILCPRQRKAQREAVVTFSTGHADGTRDAFWSAADPPECSRDEAQGLSSGAMDFGLALQIQMGDQTILRDGIIPSSGGAGGQIEPRAGGRLAMDIGKGHP